MLAASAVHAATELAAWNGEAPRITIADVEGVAPGGNPVSVLTVIDRDMPFLFDSVMVRSPAPIVTFRLPSIPSST